MAEPFIRKRDLVLALTFGVPVAGKIVHHLYVKRQEKKIQELDDQTKANKEGK